MGCSRQAIAGLFAAYSKAVDWMPASLLLQEL